ncbi:MAG: hypothetical protein J0J04_08570 [Microbacterium sp.]|uniref:hypothetical protein n=1 Tax=Microbacterium sp. TaxID=51671 RepID=UPI001AD19B02|nr:hypothetical protein [Microbacterium sp.]MBN9214830.1 hypothetical protein [Microbacterium sp.]
MTTFDESLHPRGQAGNGGQFRAKSNDAPAGQLEESAAPADPWGQMPAYPVSDTDRELFASAASYGEIDAVLRYAPSVGFTEQLTRRWAAVERGRQLRREGVPGIPASEDGPGAREDVFDDCQNDAELIELFASATEELHGDGEAPAWAAGAARARFRDAAERRRQTLVEAGVVSGPSWFR